MFTLIKYIKSGWSVTVLPDFMSVTNLPDFMSVTDLPDFMSVTDLPDFMSITVLPYFMSDTDLPDFMYFISVNLLGSQHVHSIFRLSLLGGLKMTV